MAEQNLSYPREVAAIDVAGRDYADGMYKLPGGRALYDQVHICDGGRALYLVRFEPGDDLGFRVVRRWIKWDSKVVQMFRGENEI